MSTWMVYAVVVTLLMSGAAWVLERATRDLRVSTRWIWAGALTASAVLPVCAFLAPRDPVPAMRSDEGSALVVSTSDKLDVALAQPDASPSGFFRIAIPALPAIPSLPTQLDAVAVIGWSLLSVALLFGLVRTFRMLGRTRRGWTTAQVQGHDVLVSEGIGPALVGVLRPAIVVPRWALELSPADRELIIRHEDEHRRAGDAPLLMAAVLLSVLLPWNLPIWWQLRRLRLAVEVDCDRRVLRSSRDLRRYAALLVEIGLRRSSPLLSLALAEPASFLERRILTMTHRPQPRYLRVAALTLAAAALIGAAGTVDRPVIASLAAAEPDVARTGLAGPDFTAASGAVGHEYLTHEAPGGLQATTAPQDAQRDLAANATLPGGAVAPQAVDFDSPDMRELLTSEPGGSAETTDIEIPTDAAPEASTIRGAITDASTGVPLADARVIVAGTTLASISTAAGVYALAAVPAGTHELRVERVGYASASRVVAVTDGAVLETHFALTRTEPADPIVVSGTAGAARRREVANRATIMGRVTAAESGAPLPDVQVYLVGANIGSLSRQTGQFLILNPPAGSYTLRAERIGLRTESREITIAAGETVEVNFQMSGAPLPTPGAASFAPLPGADDPIERIRSLGQQEVPPILYIDGVRVTPGSYETALSLLRTDQIERVEVMKGEAAERFYGPTARGGVVQVFRKN